MLAQDEAISKDGKRLIVADGVSASLYASVGLEALVIDRVSSIVLEGDAVLITTRRDERYLLAYEDVRAARIARSERSAGY